MRIYNYQQGIGYKNNLASKTAGPAGSLANIEYKNSIPVVKNDSPDPPAAGFTLLLLILSMAAIRKSQKKMHFYINTARRIQFPFLIHTSNMPPLLMHPKYQRILLTK